MLLMTETKNEISTSTESAGSQLSPAACEKSWRAVEYKAPLSSIGANFLQLSPNAPLRCFVGLLWVLCGPLRGPLWVFCGPLRSFVVLCGPMWSFAVFRHTAPKEQRSPQGGNVCVSRNRKLASRKLISLNSTENYRRRCLTPLSPHLR